MEKKEEELPLEEVNVCNLPYCLIVDEILTRLPVRSLARFRCVCKPWLLLLTTDHVFATKQHRHQRKTTSTAELVSSRVQITSGALSVHQLSYRFLKTSGHDDDDVMISNNTEIAFRELAGSSGTILSNSVSGLLACGYQSVRRPTGAEPTRCHYLLNPSTREIVPLPPTAADDDWGVIGLGYAAAKYKLVRLFSPAGSSRTKLCKSEVLTVGDTRGWKYLGEAPTVLPCSEPVFLDRSIHWLACEPPAPSADVIVLAFDVEEEKFRLMPIPEQERPSLLALGESGGKLWVTVFREDSSWTVWLLQNYSIKEKQQR